MKKKVYEKPAVKREETMKFPLEIISNLTNQTVCRQCSSCHGCR